MDFAALTPLVGGWSGETFLAEVAGGRQVVRIYSGAHRDRGVQAPEIDAACLRLVRGLLPVPDVLEVRRRDEVADLPALLVTSYLPGERGDLVLPRLDDERLALMGERVGEVVAVLGGIAMLRGGPFLDGDLTIGYFEGAEGLPEWVDLHQRDLDHWTADELAGLRMVAEESQDLLDTVDRTCLVHSDLNPKNLLVDPDSLEVTGVLDWEFAHAGHPFFDLGNVLRFDRHPAYVEAVLDRYAARLGTPAPDASALARAADLWALVELACRREQNTVAAAAGELVRGIARERDAAWAPRSRR